MITCVVGVARAVVLRVFVQVVEPFMLVVPPVLEQAKAPDAAVESAPLRRLVLDPR